jgi:hypothetical protein
MWRVSHSLYGPHHNEYAFVGLPDHGIVIRDGLGWRLKKQIDSQLLWISEGASRVYCQCNDMRPSDLVGNMCTNATVSDF